MPSPICTLCKKNPAAIQIIIEEGKPPSLVCFPCFDKSHKKVGTPEGDKMLKSVKK
jgi:protein-arginine kinase activator protein McsA